MAVSGGEDVDTKGEERLQGQEGQETDQVWSPAVTFCTDTQYNSLRQALVSRDRPGVWGKRTKCQPYWTSHAHTHAHAHTHTHTRTHTHTFMRSLVLIHWSAILFRRGSSPSLSPPPSVGTGFGCGRRRHLSS